MAAAGTWRADETQREPEMRIGVRGGAIRCFSAPQPRSASLRAASAVTARARRCPPSPAPARAAGRSIRPLCGSAVCLSTRAARCVVLAVRRSRGGPAGGERGRGGRLLEITEIATMEDKMLIKEVLINTGWTSAETEQTRMLLNRPSICDSTCPVLVGTIHSTISSILSCVSSRRISATPPTWRRSRRRTGGSCHSSASSNFTANLGLMCVSAGMLCAGVCDERGACV